MAVSDRDGVILIEGKVVDLWPLLYSDYIVLMLDIMPASVQFFLLSSSTS